MASFNEIVHSKRPHVKTERMQEFIRSQGEASSPTKRLKCPEAFCNKVFTSSPGLKYHLQTHSVKDPQFSCKKCHKVFKSANGLKYHREKTKCDDSGMTTQEIFNRIHELGPDYHELCDQPYSTSKPIPRHLDLKLEDISTAGGMDKLTELAIIATSPQSPLMQKPKPPWDNTPSAAVRSLQTMWDDRHDSVEDVDLPLYTHHNTSSNIRNTDTIKTEEEHSVNRDGSDPRVSTSSPLCVSLVEEGTGTSTWSHTWPTPVWQCFIRGTKIKFITPKSSVWQLAEHIGQKEELASQAALNTETNISYANDGLCVRTIHQVPCDSDQDDIEIHFSPGLPNQSDLLAICQRDHPFFVKDKGWSSIHPCGTVVHYGIPCGELCVGDVCLPPSHSDAAFSEDIFKSFEEFDFTPEDTSAVLALSSMKQRKEFDLSPNAGSAPHNPVIGNHGDSPVKPKRPMNAFLLFAKDFRLGYTQRFPKRDNRAISVMLGEQWKQLSYEKKQVYEERAKLLADRQKKMHPDCWKRKK